MESWFQRIFLVAKGAALAGFLGQGAAVLADTDGQPAPGTGADRIDTEYFDVGVFTGVLNIEDFGSEWVFGVNATFNTDENFFMQLNYLQADSSLSSFEESQGKIFSGDDRTFRHFDFLVGYNVLQAEQFFSEANAMLSSLYVVAGIGDTDFGGEGSFTYTVGVGYQLALTRDLLLRVDYRDYIYKTNLIGDDKFTHNTQITTGLSYLF
ncbi:outer membrane beta-barrel domain-containing protein [Exilibacterium tricleocarpae]|uniref:Outer membrane beta-barrel domain-containing protein n=1 Tax=Exilibacterium tricleocarpae TaxID=2591008 RepID=A0A545TAH2_9GAMM|nr:outer membrane beta-barrel domain-containing protein [Exilibacterium tricleocarpae]TQV74205.1 outer membrane beta-barrel domain-containing protein [Exilibacterium tricleocarpae]